MSPPLTTRRIAGLRSQDEIRGAAASIASKMQAIDELRHAQTQVHTISHYNKYFNGFHDFKHMHDRVWYLSVPKSGDFNHADDGGAVLVCDRDLVLVRIRTHESAVYAVYVRRGFQR